MISERSEELLSSRGVTRRDFLKFCSAVVAAAGIADLTVPRVAHAIDEALIGAAEGELFPVIWMEGGACTGCTETFTQLENPDIGVILLQMIALNYCDTLSAGAGYSLEAAKDATIANGDYILIYEGSVQTAQDGMVLYMGGQPGTEHLKAAAPNAKTILAVGSCAVNGGWMAAYPNVTGAMGVQQYLAEQGIDTPVVNIPTCPVNNEWVMSCLVDVVVMKDEQLLLDRLNEMSEPANIFNQTVHENCQRRGHFEAGEFVYELGSKEEALDYCLYAIGCKGPLTPAYCGVTQYNNHTSWCVNSGGPCIGCAAADPWNTANNWVTDNTPFYQRQRNIQIGDAFVYPTAIALGVTGVVALGLIVHGIGMRVTKRSPGGAPYEEVRVWDIKHPDRRIGDYDPVVYEEAREKYDPPKHDKPGTVVTILEQEAAADMAGKRQGADHDADTHTPLKRHDADHDGITHTPVRHSDNHEERR